MDQHNFGIHMNGDTKDTFVRSFRVVLDELADVEESMQACAPNLRNYYHLPNGNELFKADQIGFAAQVRKLADIREWATNGAMRALGGAQ